jgi:hypothetical protein
MVGPDITAVIDRELANTPAGDVQLQIDESVQDYLANP